MKTKLLFLCLALLLPSFARAELHQVTALNTTSTKVCIIPGVRVRVLIFENLGAGAVNLTIDGGSSAGGNDPSTGATGNGLQIPAASNGVPGILALYGPYFVGIKICGVMATGTTTLNIITDAQNGNSTFPTN